MKKRKLELFEPKTGVRFHIGLRMIKTVIAVYLCAMIGYMRGESALFSMIAAILCMQTSNKETLLFSFDRVLGTLVGGVFAVGLCYLAEWLGMFSMLPLYYLTIALLLIPIMLLTLLIRKSSIVAVSCIVFIGIAAMHSPGTDPLIPALSQMLDTCVGIVITMLINLAIPITHRQEAQENSDEQTKSENK